MGSYLDSFNIGKNKKPKKDVGDTRGATNAAGEGLGRLALDKGAWNSPDKPGQWFIDQRNDVLSGKNMDKSNQSRAYALNQRQQQINDIKSLRQYAQGNKSIAAQQTKLAQGQLGSNIASRLASAPTSNAASMRNAMLAQSQGSAQLGAKGAVAAAQEKLNAQRALVGAQAGLRSQDQQLYGQDVNRDMAVQGLAAKYVAMGMTKAEADRQARIDYEKTRAAASMQYDEFANSADSDTGIWGDIGGGIASGAMGALGTIIASDERVKTHKQCLAIKAAKKLAGKAGKGVQALIKAGSKKELQKQVRAAGSKVLTQARKPLSTVDDKGRTVFIREPKWAPKVSLKLGKGTVTRPGQVKLKLGKGTVTIPKWTPRVPSWAKDSAVDAEKFVTGRKKQKPFSQQIHPKGEQVFTTEPIVIKPSKQEEMTFKPDVVTHSKKYLQKQSERSVPKQPLSEIKPSKLTMEEFQKRPYYDLDKELSKPIEDKFWLNKKQKQEAMWKKLAKSYEGDSIKGEGLLSKKEIDNVLKEPSSNYVLKNQRISPHGIQGFTMSQKIDKEEPKSGDQATGDIEDTMKGWFPDEQKEGKPWYENKEFWKGLAHTAGGLGSSIAKLIAGGNKKHRTPQRFFSYSDKTVKTDKHIEENPVSQWLGSLKPYSYKYKPGYEDSGAEKHIGVMAQDMAKSDIGSKMVVKTPNGKLGLDVSPKKAIPMILAALANLDERLRSK